MCTQTSLSPHIGDDSTWPTVDILVGTTSKYAGWDHQCETI